MKKSTIFEFLDALSSHVRCCLFSRNTISKLNFRDAIDYPSKKGFHYWRQTLVLPFILVVMVLFSNNSNSQNPYIEGVAPTIIPTGGFGIDGDVYANFGLLLNGSANQNGDWVYNPDIHPGSGRGVLTNDNTGNPLNPAKTFRTVDLTGNADLNGFVQGNKFNEPPTAWHWDAHSSPQKDDMQNVMLHFDYDTNGDLWFMMAGDRSAVNGTSYIDFELYQKPLTLDGNSFASAGTDGGRTVGDLVITIEYGKGGGNPAVFIYRWQTSTTATSGFDYVLYTSFPLGSVFAASNIVGSIDVPYLAFGSHTYEQFAFAEAGVNLFKAIPGIDKCNGIATVLIKTKSSTALGSELKDMIDPIQVNINPKPVVTVNDPIICESEVSATITAVASKGKAPYTYSWVVPIGASNVEDIDSFSATVEGDYIVTVTDANGCKSLPDTATLTINTISPGAISGSQTLCYPFDPNAFTSTTPGSGGGTITYQWQISTTSATEGFANVADATSATYDAPAVSVQTWFRRVATSTLNTVICADNSNLLVVTPNAIVPGIIAGDQTLCSPFDPVAFTSTTPGSGGGTITYQWQKSTVDCETGFNNIVDATSAIYDAPTVSVATYFRRVATSTLDGVTCSANSNCLTITPEAIYPGEISGSQTLCTPFDPIAFTSVTPGSDNGEITYQWQKSTVSCDSGFADIVDATSDTYDASAVSVVTYYRRVATSTLNGAICPANSNCLTVTPNAISPGEISGDQTLCVPADPPAFTSTTPGSGDGSITYQWQKSTVDCESGFSNIVDATSAIYDAPTVSGATYFRRVATSTLDGVICSANSNCITITPEAIYPGEISGSQTLCTPFDPIAFTSVTPGSDNGEITYQWQKSTVSCDSGFADIVDATSDTYDAPAVSVVTYYRRVATSTLNGAICPANSNCLTVTPNAISPGEIAGDQKVCSGADPSVFNSTTSGSGDGAISYQWQSNTSGCDSNFSDILSATSATYDPGLATVTTYYRRVATSTRNDVVCSANSNCLTLTVEPCAQDFCTYTQGKYGNQDKSTACTLAPEKIATKDLVAKLLESDLVIGSLEKYYIRFDSQFKVQNAAVINSILPGGSSCDILKTNCIANGNLTCFNPYLTKQGRLNSGLISQTLTLGLNLRINEGLKDLELVAGKWLTTQQRLGCPAGSGVVEPVCTPIYAIDGVTITGYTLTVNPYKYSLMDQGVLCFMNEHGYGNTIEGLYKLANDALGGVITPSSCKGMNVSLCSIKSAVDMINNAFDECRAFVGYWDNKYSCPLVQTAAKVSTIETKTTEAVVEAEVSKTAETEKAGFELYPVPFKDQLTIRYKFDYTSDVQIEVFDSRGTFLLSKTDANGYLNKEYTLNLNNNSGKEQIYIVKITTNRGSSVKKVISSK